MYRLPAATLPCLAVCGCVRLSKIVSGCVRLSEKEREREREKVLSSKAWMNRSPNNVTGSK